MTGRVSGKQQVRRQSLAAEAPRPPNLSPSQGNLRSILSTVLTERYDGVSWRSPVLPHTLAGPAATVAVLGGGVGMVILGRAKPLPLIALDKHSMAILTADELPAVNAIGEVPIRRLDQRGKLPIRSILDARAPTHA
jgi:hypothetical protein